MALNCFGHFSRTQATGASVNMAWRAIDDCFHAFDVRLPSSVRTSMRVGNFDTKGNAFSADIAFSHSFAPPYGDRKLFIPLPKLNFIQRTLLYYHIYLLKSRVFSLNPVFLFFKINLYGVLLVFESPFRYNNITIGY